MISFHIYTFIICLAIRADNEKLIDRKSPFEWFNGFYLWTIFTLNPLLCNTCNQLKVRYFSLKHINVSKLTGDHRFIKDRKSRFWARYYSVIQFMPYPFEFCCLTEIVGTNDRVDLAAPSAFSFFLTPTR